MAEQETDPFAKYGGAEVKAAPSDPFAKYGGSEITEAQGDPKKKIVSAPVSGDSSAGALSSTADPIVSALVSGQQTNVPFAPFTPEERVNQIKAEKDKIAAKQKSLQQSAQAFAASGNATPKDLVALAKRAQSPDFNGTITAPTDRSAMDKVGDFIQNRIWMPLDKNILSPFNSAVSDLVIKPAAAVQQMGLDAIGGEKPVDYEAGHDVKNFFKLALNAAKLSLSQSVQGFSNVDKGYQEKEQADAQDRGLVGNTVAGVSGAVPLIIGTYTGQTEGAAANQAFSSLTKLLTAKGALNSYKDASDRGEKGNQLAASTFLGGAEGTVSGLTLDAQMLVGGVLGKNVTNKLAEYGLLKGGKAIDGLLHALAVGTVFGGTAAAEGIANGDDPDAVGKNALQQFAIGMAFEAPKVVGGAISDVQSKYKNKLINNGIVENGVVARAAKELNDQSVIKNLMGFNVDEIKEINSNPTHADDLYAQSLVKGEQAYNEKDPQKKKDLYIQQLSLKNQADIKHVSERIISNPSNFIQGVFESDLPEQDKTDLMNKIALVNKSVNPVEIHKQNISNQINDLDAQIQLVDTHAQATQNDDVSQAQSFDTKNDLVAQKTKLSMDLLDIANKSNNAEASQSIVKNIESKRQEELSNVDIPHTVLKNAAEGTHDVINNGDIVSQHATEQDAQQRADDLNRPSIDKINEINQRYDGQTLPFKEATQVGLTDQETNKKVSEPINEPSTTVKTSVGKLKIEPVSHTKLSITTPDGESKNYSVEDAIDAFDIPAEDLKTIADKYVAENGERPEQQSDAPVSDNADIRQPEETGNPEVNQGGDAGVSGEISSETAGIGGEQEAANQSAASEGTGEDKTIEKTSGQKLADAIRKKLSIKSKGIQSNFFGVPIAIWNAGIKTAAAAIERGEKIATAIKLAIQHIRDNHKTEATDRELEDQIRNGILNKPARNEGEGYHDYAGRVLEWKRSLKDNDTLSAALKKEATKSVAPETLFTNQVKKGVDVLRKDITTSIEDFNKSIGAKEGSTEHYVAAIKELIDGNSIKKVNAEKILDSLRQKDPKKVVGTEMSLLKRSLREREKAAGEGYRKAKAETKQAFLEYDAAKKSENKEKIQNLRDKYESKLEAEKKARLDQKEKITGVYKNIRSEIRDILTGLNKSRLLGGVEYSDKDILSFSNRLNNVVSEKGIDKYRDFINRSIDNADHGRDINAIRSGLKSAKGLLDKDYVPQNIKDLIRDLGGLNPERTEDPKRFAAILGDIVNSQNAKEFANIPKSEIVEFINKEREYDLSQRKEDILGTHSDIITNNDKYEAQANNGSANLIHTATLRDLTNSIIKDDKTTYNEKVKKLNEIEDAQSSYKKSLEDSVDENGNITDYPQDFLSTLDNIKNKPNEIPESQRDSLEDVVSAKQDLIQIDPDMSPEQKASLEILKKVPLAGQDASTLRLFNNVLENVINNDDHSGMAILEAKAVGNSPEGALKPVEYLNRIGKTPRSVKGANKVLESARTLRSVGENNSALLTRFSNNDFEFLNKMVTGTHFDQIQNGLTRVDHIFQEKIAKKIEALFKKYPDIARNPEAIQRLSLFSYLNQYREFASPDQQNKEIQKRVAAINKDIVLKQGGLDAEKGEAEIEKGIWDRWAQKIQDETGVDVHDRESLKNLTYEDVAKIEFLNEGEKAIYDTYREADDSLRPEHEKITNGVNKPYETWANHMRDGYRFLGSGMVDVLGTDGLGFQATDNSIDSASDSTAQRVKGDPLAQKSGEKQKVLNMNFFNVQDQGIKNMLYDIHTLKDRMIFDESMKNKQLQDAIGNENHKFYQEAVKNYVLTDMGLGKGTGEKELKVLKSGLNAITKLGTYKQLLSVTAYIKQATATIVNTLAYTGFDAKLMYQTNQEMGTPAIDELIKKHPISRRAENNANLNILSDKGIGDVNNIVSGPEKGIVNHTKEAAENFINKYFLHLEKNGTTTEPWITKPIKLGDVKTGEWSWVTHYADYLLKNGQAKDFADIDWQKEADSPNREAAAYAEQITSKQLNENTKAGRSKLLNNGGFLYTAAKSVLFPFGSFNMHKYQTLVENMRTLTSKDTYVNKESFKNQGAEAIRSLMSNFVEEAAFQGLKIGIGLSLTPMLKTGLSYTLGSLFGTKEETQKYLDEVTKQMDKKAATALQSWLGNTVGNQFFGGLGNAPQDAVQKSINWAAKKAGVKDDLFIEPNMSISQQVADANNWGMVGAAFNGNRERANDLYRIIDNKDKYNVPVDITPMQKAIIATSILSDVMAMAGLNDADLNRSIDQLRKSVDFDLAKKFKDPYYKDQNEARPVSIRGKNILLSPKHQNYYEQQKAEIKADLIKRKVDEKRATQISSERAKLNLLRKFGAAITQEGTEIKKKK